MARALFAVVGDGAPIAFPRCFGNDELEAEAVVASAVVFVENDIVVLGAAVANARHA
jgi:hypothetical protein